MIIYGGAAYGNFRWKIITQIIRQYKLNFRFFIGKFGASIDGNVAYCNFSWKSITQIIRQYKLNIRFFIGKFGASIDGDVACCNFSWKSITQIIRQDKLNFRLEGQYRGNVACCRSGNTRLSGRILLFSPPFCFGFSILLQIILVTI